MIENINLDALVTAHATYSGKQQQPNVMMVIIE